MIIPSDNTAMEPEFNAMVRSIEGVSIHATRVFLEATDFESLLSMQKETGRASRELKTAEVDIIVFGCTSGSFVKGVEYDAGIIAEIESLTGIRATTTSTAVREAFNKLGVKSIALGSPYTDELNSKAQEYFEASGYRIVKTKGLDITPDIEIGKHFPATAYELGKSIDTDEADCLFLSCTDFRTIEIIATLEKDAGKSVVTANQASLWHCLRKTGITEDIDGYGTLLENG